MRSFGFVVIAVSALAACDKGDKAAAAGSASGSAATEDKGPRKDLVEAWKKGGLAPSELAPEQVAFGSDCRKGTVGAIEVLVCQYASAAEAKQQENAGYTWVGENMFGGTSQARGLLLIVAADRQTSDKSGKTMQKLISLAPK